MYDDPNVWAEVALVETQGESPMRKARSLLAIARRLRLNSGRLSRLGAYHVRIGNPQIGAAFREAGLKMFDLHMEVRQHARRALEGIPAPARYEFTAQGNLYPTWNVETAPAGAGR